MKLNHEIYIICVVIDIRPMAIIRGRESVSSVNETRWKKVREDSDAAVEARYCCANIISSEGSIFDDN